jgi:hypothetical protein
MMALAAILMRSIFKMIGGSAGIHALLQSEDFLSLSCLSER